MAFPVYVHGVATVKSRMGALLIVEAEPVPERLASLAAGFELPQVESLSREWQTEPLSVGRYFDI